MMKQCKKCLKKTAEFNKFDNSEPITYYQWKKLTEVRIIKGKEKAINRTVKSQVTSTKKELIELFLEMLPNYLQHVFTITNQYKAITHMKTTLAPGEAIFHIDFSENYQCKYSNEIQSVHFGASRQQICLHAFVLYHYVNNHGVVPLSFCSASKCLRHDAAVVYAHLKKSMLEVMRDYDIDIKQLQLHLHSIRTNQIYTCFHSGLLLIWVLNARLGIFLQLAMEKGQLTESEQQSKEPPILWLLKAMKFRTTRLL